MEMAALLFAGLGPAGGTAAATTAASWAAGTTVTAASGAVLSTGATLASSTLSILQGITTGASMLSSVVGGLSSFASSREQGMAAELSGEQSVLESEQRVLRLRRDMLKKQGDAKVAFAASGVDISSGTARAIDDDLTSQVDYETSIERANQNARRASAKARAAGYRRRGTTALITSGLKAAGAGADYGISQLRRG